MNVQVPTKRKGKFVPALLIFLVYDRLTNRRAYCYPYKRAFEFTESTSDIIGDTTNEDD